LDVLNDSNWNRKKAAEKLGISRTTLWRKLKIYGIE
jgi:transcriptional regulator of acetoin/glycerol metabolism